MSYTQQFRLGPIRPSTVVTASHPSASAISAEQFDTSIFVEVLRLAGAMPIRQAGTSPYRVKVLMEFEGLPTPGAVTRTQRAGLSSHEPHPRLTVFAARVRAGGIGPRSRTGRKAATCNEQAEE